jgi:hypothetical protein
MAEPRLDRSPVVPRPTSRLLNTRKQRADRAEVAANPARCHGAFEPAGGNAVIAAAVHMHPEAVHMRRRMAVAQEKADQMRMFRVI